jgi:carboxymethylenebutenolidase
VTDSRDDSHAETLTSRRTVLAGALGTGFALAVQPVSAETITTPSEGLIAGEVRIPTSGGEIPAYRAMPDDKKRGKKKVPLVLVVQEIFGVHEHIKDVCRRLAKDGYCAIAPEMFVRQGDVSKLSSIDQIRPIVAKVPDAQVLSDLDATVAFAKGIEGVDATKLAITGFCWGGRITWLYSAHNPALKAGVAWYGRLVGDNDDRHPRQPVEIAGLLHAPVLGLYGGKDQGIGLDTVEQMKKALAAGPKAAKASRFQVYPDAGHAFLADYRPSYEPKAAADGWRRMRAWFRTNGVS